MGGAETGERSTEVNDQRPESQSDAYISPLTDFLLLFVLTAAAATLLVVL
jgi:hypothetical protein